MTLIVAEPFAVGKASREMDFRKLANFQQGHAGVFWSEAGGPSPWEMHPDTDEMLFILEGAIEVEVLPFDEGEGERANVTAGSFVVIPRGRWHRQWMLERTTEMYLTPGSSQMSHAADPRL